MKRLCALIPLLAALTVSCTDQAPPSSKDVASTSPADGTPAKTDVKKENAIKTAADLFAEDLEDPGVVLSPIPEPPAVAIAKPEKPASALTISAVRPVGNDLFSPRTIAITFSKPVARLEGVEVQAPPNLAVIEPAIEGEWRWLGSTTAEFTPKKKFPRATEFKVTVNAGVKALDGSVLEAPKEFSFSTWRPRIDEILPETQHARAEDPVVIIADQPVLGLQEFTKVTVNGEAIVIKEKRSLPQEQYLREKAIAEGEKVYDTSEINPNGITRYELVPETGTFPQDAEICVSVGSNVRSAEGPLTLAYTPSKHCFKTYGAQKIQKIMGCGPDSECTHGPIFIAMSNPVDLDSLKTRLTVEPSVELNWDSATTGLPSYWTSTSWARIPGSFKPGETYKITIAPGVKDVFDQSAAEGLEGEMKLQDRTPALYVDGGAVLLERTGDRTIPVYTVNAESTDVRLWKLTAEEFAAQLAYKSWSDAPRPKIAAAPVALKLDLSGQKNLGHFAPLKLDPVLNGGAPAGGENAAAGEGSEGAAAAAVPEKMSGFAMVEIDELNKNKWSKPTVVLAQVTDLAVHVHIGAQDGLAWVTSVTDGVPVAGAAIRILKEDGTEIWKGESDESGLAKLPGAIKLLPKEEKNNYNGMHWNGPSVLVVASKDGDEGAVWTTWNDGISPPVWHQWQGTSPNSRGVMFTDRGIYRPGDPLHVKGISRYFKNGILYAPVENARVKIQIQDPNGKVFHKSEKKLSAYGTFSESIKLPTDRPLGSYDVKAEIYQSGQWMTQWASFRVEEYRAPQFKVDMVAPSKSVIVGEPLKATVLSRYLFGGAMAGSQVHWSAQRTRTSFTPPSNQGFSFGDSSWGWSNSDEEDNIPYSAQAGSGDGKTDELGAFQIELGKSISIGGIPWEYELEANVTDVNRQQIAARTTVTVHPAEAYAGLRMEKDGFAEAGKESGIEIVAAGFDGTKVPGMSLETKIIRRDWKNIRKRGVGGEWFYTSESTDTDIHSCSLTSTDQSVKCAFTPDKPGMHLAKVTLTDKKGNKQVSQMSFYVIGKGFATWRSSDEKTLELVADKNQGNAYDVGEKAKILIKNPWPEAQALVTVERSGIMFRRQMSIKSSAATVEIPIKDYLIPNAFVSVTLIRGRTKNAEGKPETKPGADSGRPDIRVGYLNIDVTKKSKVLKVDIAPDKKEYRPRDKVRLTVNVTDHTGKGTQSEVSLWAVDEGILRMTNYTLPDIIAEIHADKGLSLFNSSSLIKLVIARIYGDKGEDVGGSGGKDASGSGVRNKFVTTPLFTTAETDENGSAVVEFDLPDNLTTYKIMGIAVTKKDLFGGGESSALVSKPLLAMPALPRFALLGDTVEAGVVLHRRQEGKTSVTVKASPSKVQLLENAEKTIVLEQGKPQEVRFKFRASETGEANIRFDVQSKDGDADAVLQKFPVKLPVQREAMATAGSTSSETIEGVQVPANVLDDRGGLDLTYSSTILGGLDGGMRQLVEYPYGCAEQLSSRMIPFVVLRSLFGKFGVPYAAPEGEKHPITSWINEESLSVQGSKDPDEVVRKTIASIESLQMSSGGFRYWPSSVWPSADASVYATLALGRAASVGFKVNNTVLDKAKKFLASEIASGKFRPCSVCNSYVSTSTRIFALYALAKLGAPQASYYPTFFKTREKLSLSSRAMLAAAIAADGKDISGMAGTLLDELGSLGQETPTDIHFDGPNTADEWDSWSSVVRTNALILEALTDLRPNHPWIQKLSTWVIGARRQDGTYRNTQEAAFALMALGEVSAVLEREAPNFTARTFVGSEEVATRAFTGHDMKVEHKHIPMADLLKSGGNAAQEIKMVRDGLSGILRYGIRLSYYPTRMAKTPLERGLTVQRWFEPWLSKGQQAKGFNAGDLIRIKARVATPMKRAYVVISIPLPAGLEAVDTSLATTASLPKDDNSDESSFYFYSPFNHTELRDDRILAFADELPAGVHNLEFAARATTPGSFQLMPATAELMYTPEVFGRSDGGSFSVVMPSGAGK